MAAPDYTEKAKILALNEACDIGEVKPGDCTIDHLCPFCGALAKSLAAALTRAYIDGRLSATTPPVTPHRA